MNHLGAVVRRLPVPIALAATFVVLAIYGVDPLDSAKFAGYTLLANTLPGLLLWRAVRGRSGGLAVDAALGTIVGLAIELPFYISVRQWHPQAVAAWPLFTMLLFAVVPRLRRHWRPGPERMPIGAAWTIMLGYLAILVFGAVYVFRTQSLTEPQSSTMIADFPFQFGLVGELKHAGPLGTPWLSGTPLQYHWYVYAHGAAASWLTGIEPQTLVMRLLPFPMIAAFLVALAALVHRLGGRWYAGALAVPLCVIGLNASPYAGQPTPTWSGSIFENLWSSPTQTFAELLFLGAMYTLAGILRDEARSPGAWVLFTLLVGATAGAKATYLPMLICGLLLALVLRLFSRRRPAPVAPPRRGGALVWGGPFARGRPGRAALARVGPVLGALVVALYWFGFAQLVLFGRASQGLVFNPVQTAKWTPLGEATMGDPAPRNHWGPLTLVLVLGVLGAAVSWAGLIGLLRRDRRGDPAVHVMAGFALAGLGGFWLFAHPGLSQSYFLHSATPYLAVLSALGLSALVPPGDRVPRVFHPIFVSGALAGAGLILDIKYTVGSAVPAVPGNWSLRDASFPFVVMFAVAAAAGVLLLVAGWFAGLRVAQCFAAPVAMALAMAVVNGVTGNGDIPQTLASGQSLVGFVPEGSRYAMPIGAIEASRWLRAHSGSGDLVATNSHCRMGGAGCDSRDFWLAAYSERRVLIEGWSYTEPAFESGGLWDHTLAYSGFWDQTLLRHNDAVFYSPNARNVGAFCREHNLRWLVAVNRTPSVDWYKIRPLYFDPELGKYAALRFRSGDVYVYECTSTQTPAG